MDLARLTEPFPAEDIEWRVSRSGVGSNGIFCLVLAYITARAIQKRLDDVCGPENWRVEEPRMIDVGKPAFAVGISIRIGDEWVTKWDCAEPTNIEPAKGGFSGAMKRAGAQWGIGRYLYRLDETFADVQERSGGRRWNYAKDKSSGQVYYWKTPDLPGWALPKDPDIEVSAGELQELKQAWRSKFCANSKNPAELRRGFESFVHSVVGDFPGINDHTCWTSQAMEDCAKKIEETTDPEDVDSDIPFGD